MGFIMHTESLPTETVECELWDWIAHGREWCRNRNITDVVITDRTIIPEPVKLFPDRECWLFGELDDSYRYFVGFRQTYIGKRMYLPDGELNKIGFTNDPEGYRTRQDAVSALSRQCLRWATTMESRL